MLGFIFLYSVAVGKCERIELNQEEKKINFNEKLKISNNIYDET